MTNALREWIAPVGLLCLTLPVFGPMTFAHAGEIFPSFLFFVMIFVWADGLK
jgi:hypothetical protein